MNVVTFPLLLALSGLVGALPVLWAGAFLSEAGPGGSDRRPAQNGAPVCTAFFVGKQSAGNTYLYLRNVGQETLTAQVELINEIGNKTTAQSYPIMPISSQDVVVRQPPTGTGIKVGAASSDLRVHAEAVFNDGSEPEPYRANLCG